MSEQGSQKYFDQLRETLLALTKAQITCKR